MEELPQNGPLMQTFVKGIAIAELEVGKGSAHTEIRLTLKVRGETVAKVFEMSKRMIGQH